MGIWIVFSGKYQVFHLSLGVAFVALVTWMTARLAPHDEVSPPIMRILASLRYFGWLAVQIVASAIYVTRVIINPAKHLDPRLVKLHSPQPSLLQRVILANSITLTPGTLTVDMEGDLFTVHALTRKTADDLLSDDMGRRVAALAGAPTAQRAESQPGKPGPDTPERKEDGR